MSGPYPLKLDDDAKDAFLAALEVLPILSQAAKAVGISLSAIYRHRIKNPQFAEQVKAAMASGFEAAEAEAYRRAVLDCG